MPHVVGGAKAKGQDWWKKAAKSHSENLISVIFSEGIHSQAIEKPGVSKTRDCILETSGTRHLLIPYELSKHR